MEKTFTIKEYSQALEVADKILKENNGHSFETILKTRCVYCRASPKVKTKCRAWFSTFIDLMYMVLSNKENYLNDKTN